MDASACLIRRHSSKFIELSYVKARQRRTGRALRADESVTAAQMAQHMDVSCLRAAIANRPAAAVGGLLVPQNGRTVCHSFVTRRGKAKERTRQTAAACVSQGGHLEGGQQADIRRCRVCCRGGNFQRGSGRAAVLLAGRPDFFPDHVRFR